MKRTKKLQGFTLVEIIVVLVILALLAALLVPRLTGFIDQANDQELIQRCNSCVKAGQSMYSQAYANGTAPGEISLEDMEKLAEVDGLGDISDIGDENYGIVHLTYTQGDRAVTYCRNYKTCGLHEELYNFTDVTPGEEKPPAPTTPTNDASKFYITGVNGEYIEVVTDGDYNDFGKGSSAPSLSTDKGDIFYFEGKYYCFKNQVGVNIQNASEKKRFIKDSSNTFVINSDKSVKDMSSGLNYSGLTKGDIVYNNGQYKAYFGDNQWQTGDSYWVTLETKEYSG